MKLTSLMNARSFHEPRSSGRESAPSESGGKFEPTHVGCDGSGVQGAKFFVSENAHPDPLPQGAGKAATRFSICRRASGKSSDTTFGAAADVTPSLGRESRGEGGPGFHFCFQIA